jgi:hypothetical protein
MVSAAERAPAAVGLKDISTEQAVPGWRTVGTLQLAPVMEKSEEFGPMIEKVFKLNA